MVENVKQISTENYVARSTLTWVKRISIQYDFETIWFNQRYLTKQILNLRKPTFQNRPEHIFS